MREWSEGVEAQQNQNGKVVEVGYFATTVSEDGKKKVVIDDVFPIKIKKRSEEVTFVLHRSVERYGFWTVSEAQTGYALIKNEKTMLEAIQKLIGFVKENGLRKIIDRKKELNHR